MIRSLLYRKPAVLSILLPLLRTPSTSIQRCNRNPNPNQYRYIHSNHSDNNNNIDTTITSTTINPASNDTTTTTNISTVYLGSRFEQLTMKFLHSIQLNGSKGFNLLHRGGANDLGVDFEGYWELTNNTPNSNSTSTVRILGQCKYEKSKIGPIHLRALEGTISQSQDQSQSTTVPIIGMLVSPRSFTAQSESHWRRSPFPIILVTIATGLDYHLKLTMKERVNTNTTTAAQSTDLNPDSLRRFSLNPAATLLLPNIIVARQFINGNERLIIKQR